MKRSFASAAAVSSRLRVLTRSTEHAPTATVSVHLMTKSPAPELAHYLLRGTTKQTALRITRESELIGASLSATVNRNGILLSYDVLRDDVPYAIQTLSDIVRHPKLAHYDLGEVRTGVERQRAAARQNLMAVLDDACHAAVYRAQSLGQPLFPTDEAANHHFTEKDATEHWKFAINEATTRIISAGGVDDAEILKLVEPLKSTFESVSSFSQSTEFFGGQVHVAHHGLPDAAMIVLDASDAIPTARVLSYLLGGRSRVQWGQSAPSPLSALDAQGMKVFADVISHDGNKSALLRVGVLSQTFHHGPSLVKPMNDIVSALKDVANGKNLDDGNMQRAKRSAMVDIASAWDTRLGCIENMLAQDLAGSKTYGVEVELQAIEAVSNADVASLSKKMLGKFGVVGVGNLGNLPFLEDLMS